MDKALKIKDITLIFFLFVTTNIGSFVITRYAWKGPLGKVIGWATASTDEYFSNGFVMVASLVSAIVNFILVRYVFKYKP
jgi:hypothetical protein